MHHPIQHLVFYDGVCNLCHASVQWILKNERNHDLRFAALQSDLARTLLPEHIQTLKDPESIVFYSEGRIYEGSDAALMITPYLKLPWRWLKILSWIPKRIRDRIYFYIARNRYRWFGKQNSCLMPDPSLKQRFADLPAQNHAQDQ